MMFTLEDNEKIGQYLMERIDERFKSRRQFCREYLEAGGDQASNEQLRKMSNRLSQILYGKKGIQIYDLPLFCRLLEVSCEEILSAGKIHTPTSTHLTNYAAAFSKSENEWAAYIEREDSPILNADEYGKTIIDYALEAENYDFLKYLMDKQFIWFVGTDKNDFYTGFGAGTSIEKANFPYPTNYNVLDVQLKMRDELRTHMIALAIRHEDIEMLEELHAREVTSLYQMSAYASRPNACRQYYNAKLMEALTHADNKILEYFSEEFKITDRVGYTNSFIFPFIGELVERLLQTKNGFVEYILKDAIKHNRYVYDQLLSLMDETVQYYKQFNYDLTNVAEKNRLTEIILRDLDFYDDGSLINYYALIPAMKRGLRSNIIRVNATSEDTMINRRILELNDLYDAIHNMTPKFE
ncbi:MAG: hypothetical protein K2K46_02520 [Lachnospiraceae bacterium]|nr:hypothetical protein [Lachnospiraceae bacterium]